MPMPRKNLIEIKKYRLLERLPLEPARAWDALVVNNEFWNVRWTG